MNISSDIFNTFLIGFIPFAVGCYVFWLVIAFSPDPGIEAGLEEGIGRRRGKPKHIFLKIFGGLITALAQVFSTLPFDKRRKDLDKRLIKAGRPGELSADEFGAARIIGMGLAGLAGMFIDNEVNTYPGITMGLVALGFVYPNIWLSGEIDKRRRRIFRDLPDTLDMLRLAIDAGMDLGSALKVVVERGREGPLLTELEKVERDIALGRTRADAFRSFADRISMGEINSFVLALIQADKLGASIGPILKVQSEISRTKRWQLAEALVNKMPMKMLGPLVVFIFPASFIILFTPLMIQWMQSD